MSEPTEQRICPECGHSLGPEDQLCVECGFHLGLAKQLRRATVESTELQLGDRDLADAATGTAPANTPSENPFSVPMTPPELIRQQMQQQDADQVRAIVDGALPFYMTAILAVCFCLPVLPLLIPLYSVRIMRWWSMRRQFENLSNPNSLSPFVDLELRFQSAGWQYAFSILVGALQFGAIVFAILYQR